MTSIHSPALLRRAVVLAVALAAPGLVPLKAEAQAGYPNKPVTFIVPFPPGGGTDISARTVAAKLTALWSEVGRRECDRGKPRRCRRDFGGGRGGQGAARRLHAADRERRHASINPSLYPKLPYNPDTAFAPISLICELPFVLMASPSLKANSVKELVALRQGESRQGDVTRARAAAARRI